MNQKELLDKFFNNKLIDMNFCLPAKILEYESSTRKAKVEISIKQRYADSTFENFPIIHNVPVIHPSSGGASIIFPINIGDTVLLIFCDKSLEEWLQSGNIVEPDDSREHDLTDAIAIIGLKDFSKNTNSNNNNDLIIDYSDSMIKIKKDGDIDITCNNLNVSGKISSDGLETTTATIGGKDFQSHVHSGVTSGGGTSGPPV